VGERTEVAVGAGYLGKVPLSPLFLLNFGDHSLAYVAQATQVTIFTPQHSGTAIVDIAVLEGGGVHRFGLQLWAYHVLLGEFVSLICSRFKG